MFLFKAKNIHRPTFVSSFPAVYRVSIPVGYSHRSIPLFQASRHGEFLHIAFVGDGDIDNATLEVVNHKHYDYARTALTVVNVSKPLGYRKRKGKGKASFCIHGIYTFF